MCGYRVPRKAGWDCHGLPVELEVEKQLGISSKQEIEEFGIAEFNAALPRVGLRVRRGVEPADRADRLLDRPRRPLRHPRQRLHRVGLVVAEAALGRRPPLRGPQGRPLLPALRHRRSPRTRSRTATRTSRTPPSTCASRCSPSAGGALGRVAAGLDDDALDAARQRRRRRRARGHLRRAPRSTARRLILAEPLVEKVLGEGAEVARPLLRRRRWSAAATRARSSTLADGGPSRGEPSRCSPATSSPPRTAPASSTSPRPSARTTTAVAAENGIFDPTRRQHPLQPGQPRRPLRRAASPASRAASSRTPR